MRFGSPLETGYAYIFPVEFGEGAPAGAFIRNRVRDIGLFSPDYLLFNTVHMFLAGPHVEFAGRYMTHMASLDARGASLFLVTPALLLAFLGRWDRVFGWAMLTCALILGLTLFYHSNGFSQYSTQRYALDWLPVFVLLGIRAIRKEHVPLLAVLIGYSMAVTLAMVVLAGLLKV